MAPKYNIVDIARQFLYVREAQGMGQNRGLRVESIQNWSGGEPGDSWCMEFVWMVLDIAYQGKPPFGRMQSCEEFRKLAANNGWLVEGGSDSPWPVGSPQPGWLYLFLDSSGSAHHIGIVTMNKEGAVFGIAGNTSWDGTSANGDRVAEREIVIRRGTPAFVDLSLAEHPPS